MTKKTDLKKTDPIPATTVARITQEVNVAASPLVTITQSLAVVDDNSFAVADSLLSRITTARKLIEKEIATILDPLNESRKAALIFKRKLDDPLEIAELRVRGLMKEYKQKELRRIQEAEQARIAEAQRLQREADEKRRKEESAKTQAMRDRLAKQRAELEQQAAMAEAKPIQAPVEVQGSGTRTVRCWRVKDMAALVAAVADPKSDVPLDILDVNAVLINQHFKAHESEVAKWPGIEIYDDVRIVRR